MGIKLIFAIVAMTLALTFYTIGVFGERKVGTLKGWLVGFFGLGLVCDSTGTKIMTSIHDTSLSAFKADFHIITGGLALVLMAIHFVWALYVLWKGSEQSKANFHKFSVVVWAFWLLPYIAGMIIGMTS